MKRRNLWRLYKDDPIKNCLYENNFIDSKSQGIDCEFSYLILALAQAVILPAYDIVPARKLLCRAFIGIYISLILSIYFQGTFYGGYGAKIQGDFVFPAGTQLNIVVGHRGGNSVEVQGGQATTATAASLGKSIEDNAGTGGGGGSFVYSTANVLYIAAGGGGGATAGWNGVNGQAGQSGTAAVGSSSTLGAGGTSGHAGGCCNIGSYHGGVGAGWHSVGGSRAGLEHGERGGGISQGWVGGQAGKMNSGNNGGPAPGAVGGFGGGGGGSEDNGASGGGGGYSGGGTGGYNNAAGGGGGSFCGGTNCLATTGGNTGSEYGYVKIAMI